MGLGRASPRVVILLESSQVWSRGILRGFARVAHEQGWTLLRYCPNVDLQWVANELSPDALVLGPSCADSLPGRMRQSVCVSVNFDRSEAGIASTCVNEEKVAQLAAAHFVGRGFRRLTVFRFDDSAFGAQRERHFRQAAERAGARVEPGWWVEGTARSCSEEPAAGIRSWLQALGTPCGVFACSDAWASIVARYAALGGLRIPDDLALLGVDNETFECEIMSPPLSSVAVPWRSLGEGAARLVQRGLRGEPIAGTRELVDPTEVIARRSSDTFAIEDPLVARAVTWIYQHAEVPVTVPMVARAVDASRQQLQRHFRGSLGRTVMQEVRHAHVELARKLLSTSTLPMAEVATRSGFAGASQLSVAFRREVGVPPGVYRRQVGQSFDAGED